MRGLRFRFWRRGGSGQREAHGRPDQEDLDGAVRRNRAAYADLQAALALLLAARNDHELQIGSNLRRVYPSVEDEVPARFRQLLEQLSDQDRGA